MSPIVPYANENPYRSATLHESLEFWGYACKKRPASVILYVLSFIIFLFITGQLARQLSGIGFGGPIALIAILTILPMLFIYFPQMPALYKYQFKRKIRRDIAEGELTVLVTDMVIKSLEYAAMAIIIIGLSCALVYALAKYLALSDMVTLVLLALTAFNVFLASLVVFSLGGYNKEFLRKTFTDEEYKRSTSISSYRRILAVLIFFDFLAALLLTYIIMNKLTTGLVLILLVAIADNVLLALSLWNYREIKNKDEAERKAIIPQLKMSLASFIIVDIILAVSWIIHMATRSASYEMTAFSLLTAFLLAAGILSILWFLFNAARRILKT